MKSKRRLGICLAVGILVLAVSAAAAFGSVNGYARYKQAVKDLLLREDNFTVQAQTHLSVDGERLLSVQMDYAKAGLNSAYHSREDHGGESHQEYRTVLDGVRTRFAGDSSFYSCESIERGEAFSNLLGYDVDNEMERRLVDFAETSEGGTEDEEAKSIDHLPGGRCADPGGIRHGGLWERQWVQ